MSDPDLSGERLDGLPERTIGPAATEKEPLPPVSEPIWFLPQQDTDDCTICCIAMATGLSYGAVLAQARVSAGGYRYGGTPGTMSPKGILIDLGFAAKRLGCEGDGQGAGVRSALWGRRAILSVPSLNGFTGHHDVYWDGKRVWDPSPKERYADTLPDAIHWATVMDEVAREHSSPRQVSQPIRDELIAQSEETKL